MQTATKEDQLMITKVVEALEEPLILQPMFLPALEPFSQMEVMRLIVPAAVAGLALMESLPMVF